LFGKKRGKKTFRTGDNKGQLSLLPPSIDDDGEGILPPRCTTKKR
jgi:hypothetical protein